MKENKYSSFPDNATDEDIFEMMITENLKAICYNCKTENSINVGSEFFTCSKCDSIQFSPLLNPNELKKCDRL